MISAETVERTWRRVGATPPHRAHRLSARMGREQPVVMAFLLAVGDSHFNRHEAELILYMGLVVWQIMKQAGRPLRRVTESVLDEAEAANNEFLEMLASDTDADFEAATMTMLEEYPEPEVLRYIVETIMDEENYTSDDPPIRDEYRGLAFVHLKSVLDAFVRSLAP